MNVLPGFYQTDSYATFEENSDIRLGKILQIFAGKRCHRVLDVGCGDGSFARRLREVSRADEVCGVEISPEGTRLALENGVKAVCLNIDTGEFPFADGYFDAVFCGEIIEHLYDPDHLIDEVYRTLNPGGLFILSTPNLAWWLNRLALALGFYPFGLNPSLRYPLGHIRELKTTEPGAPVFADHIRLFTLPSLTELLKRHSFTINSIIPVSGQIPMSVPLAGLFNIIDRVFCLAPSLSFRFVISGIKE